MNKINFISSSAQRIYDDYMVRVGKCIALLGEADKTELVMELNSHIYEAHPSFHYHRVVLLHLHHTSAEAQA